MFDKILIVSKIRVNLSGANLASADLTATYLGGANLSEANLKGTLYRRANALENANLVRSH